MQFLNMLMLAGVAGLSIPIILHILNRRHSKLIEWGAMRFILDSLMTRRRNILLEEVLLLATRCLLIALLALAMARPFVTPNSMVPWMVVLPCGLLAVVSFGISFALWNYPVWRSRMHWTAFILAFLTVGSVALERWLMLRKYGGGQARDIALVIDGSSSMLMEVDGKANFDRAREEARKVIEAAPRGARFSLLVAGGAPNLLMPTPTDERGRLLRALDEAKPMHGTMRALDTLAFAANTLALGNNPNKQILLIGDGQAEGWNHGDDAQWSHLVGVFKKLPTKPQVVWRRLPVPANIRNLTLSRVDFSRDIIGTDRKVRINVTVENTGVEGVTPQAVKLEVEGKAYSDTTLNQIEPGSSHTVSFWHQFSKPGTHPVRAVVDAMDALPADDEAVRVAHVIGSLRVLVVEGAAGNLMQRPGGYLALSLMPDIQALLSGGRSERFLVSPEIVTTGDFVAMDRYDGVAVVVLADVPSLPTRAAEGLAAFAANGGGVMVVNGPNSDPAFYNNWNFPGLGRVTPLPLGELRILSGTNLVAVAADSAAMDGVRAIAAGSDLGNAVLNRWWHAPDDAGPRVALRLTNGDPFVADHGFGHGNVAQVLSGLDAGSGNLAMRHAFLPLMHELVYHLAQPYSVNLNRAPAPGLTIMLAGQGVDSSAVGEGGLRAQYFPDKRFRRAALTRIDPAIDFDWGLGSPGPGVPVDHFGARWTATLQVPQTGEWAFYPQADDRLRVEVGPHKFEADFTRQTRHAFPLEAGVKYPFKAEYEEDTGGASARLWWSGPGFPEPAPIPPRFFTPAQMEVGEVGERIASTAAAPGGETLSVDFVAGRGGIALRMEDSVVPGLYEVAVPPSLHGAIGHFANAAGKLLFCVMSNPRESVLTPLGDGELGFFARHIDLMPANSVEDLHRAVKGNAFGREIWRMLAIAMFLLLLSEIALTRWIAIQRKTGEEGRVLFDEAVQPTTSFREHVERMKGGGE